MTTQFDELGLSNEILKAVEDLGFEEPSPIQVLTIPHILAGRDVIGQAQTGTGKTAAFGLPILETVDPQNRSTQALILCPTRELASVKSTSFLFMADNPLNASSAPLKEGCISS